MPRENINKAIPNKQKISSRSNHHNTICQQNENQKYMRFLSVFFFLLHVSPASATSNGLGGACFASALTLCNILCPNDTPRPWTKKNKDGVLTPCCPAGMDLVAPPTRNPAYSLTSPHQKYTPGSIVTVSLDVLKKDAKYLGLLMYAVQDDGREIRVGTWAFPGASASNPRFWTPPNCNGKVVMHKHGVCSLLILFHFMFVAHSV